MAQSRGWPLVELDGDPDDPLRCTLTVWDVLDWPRPRSAEEARARLAQLGWDDDVGDDGDDA
ncbi:MAG TPA: hypothetical protein VMW47_06595 [Verrucomicrobiae bacterium]|nr:hypothetical protein [Verrucomicrobiae bacterium]